MLAPRPFTCSRPGRATQTPNGAAGKRFLPDAPRQGPQRTVRSWNPLPAMSPAAGRAVGGWPVSGSARARRLGRERRGRSGRPGRDRVRRCHWRRHRVPISSSSYAIWAAKGQPGAVEAAARTLRELVMEFGPAELLDYVPRATVGDVPGTAMAQSKTAGVIIGKVSAAWCSPALAIPRRTSLMAVRPHGGSARHRPSAAGPKSAGASCSGLRMTTSLSRANS